MKNFVLPLFFVLIILNTGCKKNTTRSISEVNTSEAKVPLEKKTQSVRNELYSPEKELAGFTVPEGFLVELVASERDGVVNPIDLTFDDAGRLWTQTGSMYPLDPVADIKWKELLNLMNSPEAQESNPSFKRILDLYRGVTKGDDKVLIITDLYKNISAKTTVWADGLAIPQSILPYKNGCYVAQGSELFFLSDTNNDGKANSRTSLFDGFGFTDTHTMSHTLVRGPGSWIHFSQGALNRGEVKSKISNAKVRIDYSKIARFSLNAEKIELVSSGLNNIWGFQLRGNGQWYGCEANDLGYSVVPMEVGSGYPGIGGERLRSYQPWMPELHEFRVGGTGISGLAFADDIAGSFPEEWKDVAFLANPIASAINAVKIKRNNDGSVSAELLPDFLTSEDDWFRPVNMEFGPDGCLYVADWYNKIVSHNELPTTHPDRDKSHGRIWRIRHKSQKQREIPNLLEVETKQLTHYLKSPSLWAKRAAWHQISDRPKNDTKVLRKELLTLVLDEKQDETTRIAALWSLEGIHYFDQSTWKTLINSTKENLRREAVRSLASFQLEPNEVAELIQGVSEDSNPMVRSEVLRTLEAIGKANSTTIGILVNACKPALNANKMGGSYERLFERYLARKALEAYPKELKSFINTSQANQYPASNIIWAAQALPIPEQREQVFLDFYKKVNYTNFDEPTFVLVAHMLNNPKVYEAVKPILGSESAAFSNVNMALSLLGQVKSDQLSELLQTPINALLSSTKENERLLGLEAATKLNSTNSRQLILGIGKSTTNPKTLALVIAALEIEARLNANIFEDLAKNTNLETTTRARALKALSQTSISSALEIVKLWAPNWTQSQPLEITSILSTSKTGADLLIAMYEQGIVENADFDLSSAERVRNANKQEEAQNLLDAVILRVETEKQAFAYKLNKFTAIAEHGKGNPENGRQLFQTCLLCHRVGKEGNDIAPALDGSAKRENEALITAILNPDAALESSYAIYRVIKKDGNTIEGYLSKKDSRGTTIAFMGGSTVFIGKVDIQSEGFLGGRSFMPKGLIDSYTEKQVADLFAYIKTLN